MKKIVHRRLEWFMESNHILSKSQCGFMRGLSTIDILLRLEHIIRSSLLNRDTCLAVYLDLSSAFDKSTPHGSFI